MESIIVTWTYLAIMLVYKVSYSSWWKYNKPIVVSIVHVMATLVYIMWRVLIYTVRIIYYKECPFKIGYGMEDVTNDTNSVT